MDKTLTRQYLFTPAAGKRLIAKALAASKEITHVLKTGTLVLVAGTTNGYLAEEILSRLDPDITFSLKNFFRGITFPPGYKKPPSEAKSEFYGDLVFIKGECHKGKTIFDVAGDLKQGDVIIKGANALNYQTQQAGIYIGHQTAGTIGAALQAVAGRRVQLILPVGLEKRTDFDLNETARLLGNPTCEGPRLLPVTGQIVSELEAINMLCGAQARLVAAGGVCGAEGSVWLAVSGTESQQRKLDKVYKICAAEPAFTL